MIEESSLIEESKAEPMAPKIQMIANRDLSDSNNAFSLDHDQTKSK